MMFLLDIQGPLFLEFNSQMKFGRLAEIISEQFYELWDP